MLGPTGLGDLGQLSHPNCSPCVVEVDRHFQWVYGHNLGQPSKYIQDLTTNMPIWITVKAASWFIASTLALQSVLSSLARGTFIEGTSDSLGPLKSSSGFQITEHEVSAA